MSRLSLRTLFSRDLDVAGATERFQVFKVIVAARIIAAPQPRNYVVYLKMCESIGATRQALVAVAVECRLSGGTPVMLSIERDVVLAGAPV